VRYFASYLRAGTHSVSFIAVAVTPGVFTMPPATASVEAQPELLGMSSAGKFVVVKDKLSEEEYEAVLREHGAQRSAFIPQGCASECNEREFCNLSTGQCDAERTRELVFFREPCNDQERSCAAGFYCSTNGGCHPISECAVQNDPLSGTCPDGACTPLDCEEGLYCTQLGACAPAEECDILNDAVSGFCPHKNPDDCTVFSCPEGEYCTSIGDCAPLHECPKYNDNLAGPCPPCFPEDGFCPDGQYCSVDGQCYPDEECRIYFDFVLEEDCPRCEVGSCGTDEYCSVDGSCYPAEECFIYLDDLADQCRCPNTPCADDSLYCSTNGFCYPVEECATYNDSFDGVCPDP
jgi:hypothetical protein